MSDESRIRQLLEETLDSHRTPEEVCADFPQLLWQVRERLRCCQDVEAQLNGMFPPSKLGAATRRGRLLCGIDPLPQIPGYQVEAVLGRGGVGVVYKARHLKLNRYVALKMLLSGVYANPHELARFTQEAEAVASLRHAHIVQVHDIGDLRGMPYFTMEFMEGGSLAQKLAGVPQPAAYAASLMETLATAVHVAHHGGIIHRDLKPSNVLLCEDGAPKLTDFGLARRIEGEATVTQNGAHVGTPSYMAPEQATGDMSAIGPPTDIYGLGAILYELLTGRPPFRAETASETERQLIFEDPVWPSRLNRKVPRDLETICLKCLSKDPSRRYPSASALADDLRRFREGVPIKARPLGWAGRLLRWSRRHPSAAALVALMLALIGVGVFGGFWVQRQWADSRAAESRQIQAVQAALAHADDLRKLGHWPEARASLVAASSLLGASAPAELRERLRRAGADADMVVRLEGIRLRLSEGTGVQGRVSPIADRLYSDAFSNYGINLTASETAAAAERIDDSAIRDILLVFLHDWLYWVTDENRQRLRDLLDASDKDPWRSAFREARANNDIAQLEGLAAAPEVANQPPALLSGLGGVLLNDGQRDKARALLREAQQRHPSDFWINYLLGHFLEQEHPMEAAGYFRAAVAIRPRSDQAYTLLGRALREAGDADGAIDALHHGLELNPSRDGIAELARLLAPKGRLEEVRLLWEKLLSRDPPDHESWYGYAPLCLYLGKEDEYRRARTAMLRRFGQTNNWIAAERTTLASLLRPATGDELQRVAALADRAVIIASKLPERDNPYIQFVKGLSEYRQGRPDQALTFLRQSASKLPNRPGPRLALAMALFRSGSPQEARKALAAAVTPYDWKEPHDDHPTVWVSHVLRREAEAMILPDLPAFLQGKYQPRDNDERLALLGICESQGLNAFAAQLYADAFTADPLLADALIADCRDRAARENDPHNRSEVLKTDPRYLASRCAASAGCGIGNDAARLSGIERTRWCVQAREWLQADLTAWMHASDGGSKTARELASKMFELWQVDPDLAGLREPNKLNALPAEERAKWAGLWKEIGDALEDVRHAPAGESQKS